MTNRWPIVKGSSIVLLLAINHWWDSALSLLGVSAPPNAGITTVLEIAHFSLPVIIATVVLWTLWDLYRLF